MTAIKTRSVYYTWHRWEDAFILQVCNLIRCFLLLYIYNLSLIHELEIASENELAVTSCAHTQTVQLVSAVTHVWDTWRLSVIMSLQILILNSWWFLPAVVRLHWSFALHNKGQNVVKQLYSLQTVWDGSLGEEINCINLFIYRTGYLVIKKLVCDSRRERDFF